MQIFKNIFETKAYLKSQTGSIGFVPTMGALHEGHISLINRAKSENELVVCSIFVNPTQFNNPDDLAKYPRTLERDCEMLEKAGCDVVFVPDANEMYPEPPQLKLHFGNLEQVMEGQFRPGHFNGVGIVVAKLFHIAEPTRAYFGLKDIQQVAVINRLVKDLHFNVEIVPCPTLRENDGLAMSSRNARLSADARTNAPAIYQALREASVRLINGMPICEIKEQLIDFFSARPEFNLEYFDIADFATLEPLNEKLSPGNNALCIAAYLDGVRLIDNLIV